MEIEIHNYLSGSQLLSAEPRAWDVIAILDSNLRASEFIDKHSRSSLVLHFDDVTASVAGKRSPTADQIESAFDFASDSNRLLVCCRAGQSRSAALAFSIAFDLLGSDTAIGLLNPKRHSPNSLVIRLAASVVDDPMFGTMFHDWQTANAHIRLTDYMDEVAKEVDALEAKGVRNRITR